MASDTNGYVHTGTYETMNASNKMCSWIRYTRYALHPWHSPRTDKRQHYLTKFARIRLTFGTKWTHPNIQYSIL